MDAVNAGLLESADQEEVVRQSFFVEMCRRGVREGEEIIHRVEQVLDFYKRRPYTIPGDPDLGIEEKSAPVVTAKTTRMWARQRKHAEDDCLTDDPKVNLYIEKRDSGRLLFGS